jgi:hypothetical protein
MFSFKLSGLHQRFILSSLLHDAASEISWFLDRELLLTRKLLNQQFLVALGQSHHFESFTVTTMTWLTITSFHIFHHLSFLSSYSAAAISGTNCFLFRSTWFHLGCSCCSVSSFQYCFFCRSLIVCPFVLVLMTTAFSVLRFTASDYPSGIFKLFLFLSVHFLLLIFYMLFLIFYFLRKRKVGIA